jgi:hypothetical protein
VRWYLSDAKLLSVLNNSLGLFDANFAIVALFLFQQLLIAAIAIAVAEAEELLEQSVNETCNGTSACYASEGDGNDLTVVGGFLFLEEKHDIGLLYQNSFLTVKIVYHNFRKMQGLFEKNEVGTKFYRLFFIWVFPWERFCGKIDIMKFNVDRCTV